MSVGVLITWYLRKQTEKNCKELRWNMKLISKACKTYNLIICGWRKSLRFCISRLILPTTSSDLILFRFNIFTATVWLVIWWMAAAGFKEESSSKTSYQLQVTYFWPCQTIQRPVFRQECNCQCVCWTMVVHLFGRTKTWWSRVLEIKKVYSWTWSKLFFQLKLFSMIRFVLNDWLDKETFHDDDVVVDDHRRQQQNIEDGWMIRSFCFSLIHSLPLLMAAAEESCLRRGRESGSILEV